MTVETRIVALYRSGARDDAGTLAREVLRNDAVRDVTLGADAVRVVTDAFVGEHAVVDRVDGEVVVAEHGEYAVRANEHVTFSVNTLYDNVFDAIDAADAEAASGPHADDGTSGDRRATF